MLDFLERYGLPISAIIAGFLAGYGLALRDSRH